MKFTQVNKEQIEQASEAIETIIKLKRVLAGQRLINKVYGKYTFGDNLTSINLTV